MIDSHAFGRNYRDIPCILSPFCSVVTSYKTTVQSHNQDINIDTVKIQNIAATTRLLHVALYSYPHLTLAPIPSLNPDNH